MREAGFLVPLMIVLLTCALARPIPTPIHGRLVHMKRQTVNLLDIPAWQIANAPAPAQAQTGSKTTAAGTGTGPQQPVVTTDANGVKTTITPGTPVGGAPTSGNPATTRLQQNAVLPNGVATTAVTTAQGTAAVGQSNGQPNNQPGPTPTQTPAAGTTVVNGATETATKPTSGQTGGEGSNGGEGETDGNSAGANPTGPGGTTSVAPGDTKSPTPTPGGPSPTTAETDNGGTATASTTGGPNDPKPSTPPGELQRLPPLKLPNASDDKTAAMVAKAQEYQNAAIGIVSGILGFCVLAGLLWGMHKRKKAKKASQAADPEGYKRELAIEAERKAAKEQRKMDHKQVKQYSKDQRAKDKAALGSKGSLLNGSLSKDTVTKGSVAKPGLPGNALTLSTKTVANTSFPAQTVPTISEPAPAATKRSFLSSMKGKPDGKRAQLKDRAKRGVRTVEATARTARTFAANGTGMTGTMLKGVNIKPSLKTLKAKPGKSGKK
jgi:hypothetical protein